MPLIECKNLVLGYGKITIARNISFNVSKGDFLCIVGENGTGKTTLVNSILGINKQISGIINLDKSARNSIGYLPQKTDAKNDFPATVMEVVISGCQSGLNIFKPFYSNDNKKLAIESMKKLGINHLASRPYSELSGGQQQRTLLARALCATKSIIILDEPAASLDQASALKMYKTLRELNTNHDVTIIIITHDLESIISSATHILCLKSANGDNFFGTKTEWNRR